MIAQVSARPWGTEKKPSRRMKKIVPYAPLPDLSLADKRLLTTTFNNVDETYKQAFKAGEPNADFLKSLTDTFKKSLSDPMFHDTKALQQAVQETFFVRQKHVWSERSNAEQHSFQGVLGLLPAAQIAAKTHHLEI